jgi:uncharacterized protein (TIGR02594 family)
MTEAPWLKVATKYIGLQEIVGPQHNQTILKFYKNSGAPQIKDDETAWCAAFVGQCLYEAGYKNTRSLAARSYINWGKKCEPKPGAVVVFARGSNPALGHVGIVKSVSGGNVRIISGNDSNQVKESTRSIASALAFRWPAETVVASNTKEVAKQGSWIGGILAGMGAFITGHKALLVVAGAFILIGGIMYYLENKKNQNAK